MESRWFHHSRSSVFGFFQPSSPPHEPGFLVQGQVFLRIFSSIPTLPFTSRFYQSVRRNYNVFLSISR